MVSKQHPPRFTVIHRDTDISLIEDDAITLVRSLHTAILEVIEHDQDNPFRFMAHEFTTLIHQPF